MPDTSGGVRSIDPDKEPKGRVTRYYNQAVWVIALAGLVLPVIVSVTIRLSNDPQGISSASLWILSLLPLAMLGLIIKTSQTFYNAITYEVASLQESQAQLRETTKTLRALIESSPAAVIALDEALCITLWNPAAERIFGWTSGEATGVSLAELIPGDENRIVTTAKLALQGISVPDLEISVGTKAGERLLASVSIAQLHDREGKVRGVIAVMNDVTQRREIDEAIRRQKILEERERARSQLVEIAAHELRNPLASVKGILSFIRWRTEAGQPVNELAKKMAVLEREVDRLTRLIDDVTRAFRAQEDRLQLALERVDLAHIVEEALVAMEPLLESRELEVAVERAQFVEGDAARLYEVVQNLVTNAVKYSPDGTRVEVRLRGDANHVRFEVADRGIGIPEAELTRIFEGFFRGSNVKANDPGGLGFGLYLCKETVERHGGRIWAENRPGGGALFVAELPRASADSRGTGQGHGDRVVESLGG